MGKCHVLSDSLNRLVSLRDVSAHELAALKSLYLVNSPDFYDGLASLGTTRTGHGAWDRTASRTLPNIVWKKRP